MITKVIEVGTEYSVDENDIKQGKSRRWYKSGQLKESSDFIDGKLDGEFLTWHTDGNIHMYTFFEDDNIHGECKAWRLTGELYRHEFCKNGLCITPEVKKIVTDITNLTPEDETLIKLKLGIPVCNRKK